MESEVWEVSIEKATMKQKDLAMTIAEELGIDVPDEDSSDAYSDFIGEYYGEFKRERNKRRYESGEVWGMDHFYHFSDHVYDKQNKNPETV